MIPLNSHDKYLIYASLIHFIMFLLCICVLFLYCSFLSLFISIFLVLNFASYVTYAWFIVQDPATIIVIHVQFCM